MIQAHPIPELIAITSKNKSDGDSDFKRTRKIYFAMRNCALVLRHCLLASRFAPLTLFIYSHIIYVYAISFCRSKASTVLPLC